MRCSGWPLLVAAPVRAGNGEQLERADLARRRDVRPAAQVDERPVLVRRHLGLRLALGRSRGAQVVEDLDLERLAVLVEPGAAGVRRQDLAHERMVGRNRRRHALLDRGQIVDRQRPGQLEVVVEAVLDGRADAQLRARKEVHDRLGHDVRRRVAHRVERVAGAGVEQLVGRLALGRLERELFLFLILFVIFFVFVLVGHPGTSGESKDLSSNRQDERLRPPAVPPAFALSRASAPLALSRMPR